MFYIVQAGSALQAISDDGATIVTLTLPVGVTIDPDVRGQFHVISRQVIFTRASSVNLWIDPVTFIVRPMVITAPVGAATLATAAPAGLGLTGQYIAAYSYAVLDGAGAIINESPLSPLSNVVALANQAIDWSGISVSPTAYVNARVLYRSVAGANGEVLFQRSILADNVTTVLAGDETADSALGLLPAFQGNDPPPGTVSGTRLALAVTWQSRLCGVDGADPHDFRYSEPNAFYSWPLDNGFKLTVDGEDEYGCTGFLPRRSELVILKRSRVLRLVGNDNRDFELIPDTSGEAVGCIAPFSCVVIDDIGYFLGQDGVYRVGPGGVESISRGKVDPWFITDLFFDRDEFPNAFAAYNPVTHAYELHLVAVNTPPVVDTWIAFDIRSQSWYGAHHTEALTPSARALGRNSNGTMGAIMGGTDGYLYRMNETDRTDYDGATPLTGVGISVDWITAYFHGDDPDLLHYWGQATFHIQNQLVENVEPAPVAIDVGVQVGNITVGVASFVSVVFTIPQTVDRYLGPRFGVGRLMRWRMTHSTAGGRVMLRGFEIPVSVVGRR